MGWAFMDSRLRENDEFLRRPKPSIVPANAGTHKSVLPRKTVPRAPTRAGNPVNAPPLSPFRYTPTPQIPRPPL